MGKNILWFLMGALAVAVLAEQPLQAAKDPNYLSSIAVGMSSKELGIIDRRDGKVYYYNKLDGKLMRIHEITQLDQSMTKVK